MPSFIKSSGDNSQKTSLILTKFFTSAKSKPNIQNFFNTIFPCKFLYSFSRISFITTQISSYFSSLQQIFPNQLQTLHLFIQYLKDLVHESLQSSHLEIQLNQCTKQYFEIRESLDKDAILLFGEERCKLSF
jgi:hypothetical protein